MGLFCPTDLEAQVQRMPEAFTLRDCVAWEENGDRSGSSSMCFRYDGWGFHQMGVSVPRSGSIPSV